MEVGVREFRDHLSRWIDVVRRGEEIVVTDRGRPVVRVVPVSDGSGWDRLIEEGLVHLPSKPRQRARDIRRVEARVKVADPIRDQRR